MFKALAFVLVLVLATPASAVDDVRQQKIAELMRTIKLQDMLEQQIAQTRASYMAFGKKIFAQFQDQIGSSADPAQKARMDSILQNYFERAATLWKAEDLAAVWSERFGQDLSNDDLDQILAFYRSPVGPKVVAANQAANAALTEWVNTQSQRRIRDALEQLAADLREAIGK
jgi:hypothetical protein